MTNIRRIFHFLFKNGVVLVILVLFLTQNSLAGIYRFPLDVSIAASPKTINPGSISTITGIAVCADTGTPISGADVSYRINDGIYISGGTTDSSGHYSFTVTSYPSGSFLLWVNIFEQEYEGYGDVIYYNGQNSLRITVNNTRPNAPAQPQGQSSGYIETSYTYSTIATDSNKDQIKYIFDWGDGSKSNTNFVNSSKLTSSSHRWTKTGTYNVRAKATDGRLNSGWSETLHVKIDELPQLDVYPDPLYFELGTMNAGKPESIEFSISNAGGGTLNWSVSDNQPWITLNRTSGTNSGAVTININSTGLSPGNYSGTIVISSNVGNRNGSVSLIIIPSTGVITINTSPSGAEVFLDSESKGTANPTLTITDVEPGSHTVRCRLFGYSDNEFKIHVTAGKVMTINCPLTLSPILLIVIAIIAILVVVGIFLCTSSKLQLVPKQNSLPCDGESTLPIMVQFINRRGKKKTQKKDREVKMETTSGDIKNVVIPAGKECAESTLTSSNECGQVIITGKSGNQDDTVNVDFKIEEACLDLEISPASIPADGKSTATATIRIKDVKGNYISFLDEKTVELTISSGTITSPVKIPVRYQAENATITSGAVCGTATVNASMDKFKGEGIVEFSELPKRYCMHCGTVMAMEARGCPKCENIPPSGVDTKQCSTCDAVLPQTARFCDKCGARQPEMETS